MALTEKTLHTVMEMQFLETPLQCHMLDLGSSFIVARFNFGGGT